MFDSRNTKDASSSRLRPIGGIWSLFSRVRIVAGGGMLEDMDMYNRVHEMLNIFGASDSRQNVFAEGFERWWATISGTIHVSTSWL